MYGEGSYDWESEQLHFVGDELGGTFRYDVGLLIHAEVQADVIGFNWQSDLLGPFDYLIEDEAEFDPYLLMGNPDRPAMVADSAEGATVASIPLVPDIVIASGNLDIDLGYDVEAQLWSNSISADGPLNSAAVIEEGEAVSILPDQVQDYTDPLEVDATLLSHVTTQTTIVIRPHLVMEILGTPYDIAGIDIPVELPEMDDDWIFETQTLQLERPEPSSGESGEGGDEDTGTDDGLSDTGDETGAGFDDIAGDDGCNCRAKGGQGSPATGLLALLALPLLRRRRRG
jgi:MYXO-CTERM domain-containing protein